MQALYSYYLSEKSLQAVNQENLEKQFAIDPAKDDFNESEAFEKRVSAVGKLYQMHLNQEDIATDSFDDELIEAASRAADAYHSSLSAECSHISKRMLSDISDLHEMYFKLLLLPLEFSHIEKLEKEKKDNVHIPKEDMWHFNLVNNPVTIALGNFGSFQKEIENRKISWSSDIDILKGWYKEIIQKNERFAAYQRISEPSLEDHIQAVSHLMKKIILKDEVISDFLGSVDLRWHENKPVLSSLVVKTLQSFDANNPENSFEIKTITKNEKDDLDFFKKLFEEVVKNDGKLEGIISNKTKNWDISRIALMDKIILKMALVEMTSFPTIPVKVTINEFIEISKLYSTPKSKQFVNGILDVLSNELTSDGVIRKSGRGLIDNK